jgi:sugar O-acyltransferase (sialic acid O-acetyltransferase NeuD family)
MSQTSPVIIVGGGGHAKVLISAMRAANMEIQGIADSDPKLKGKSVLGIPVLGDDGWLADQNPKKTSLVLGVGSVAIPEARKKLFENLKKKGFSFKTVIHPTAIVADEVKIGEGAQIMAGAIIQPGTQISDNVIVNTGVIVDHDCVLGTHVHLAPGVTLSGGVEVGAESHLGTGAVVKQGIRIGRKCLVGAGSVVVEDLPDGVTAKGVPARHG